MKATHQRTWTVISVAVLVLGGFTLMFYPRLTDVRYSYEQWRLETSPAIATAATETGGVALPADAIANLRIPAIGLDAYVVEGTDDPSLLKGPGHYPNTPLPGEGGNAGIAGHRTMYGQVFHDLHELVPGDRIYTATTSHSTTYEVVEVIVVDPSQIDVVAPTGYEQLTLTTCHPIGSAAQRLVVVALPAS